MRLNNKLLVRNIGCDVFCRDSSSWFSCNMNELQVNDIFTIEDDMIDEVYKLIEINDNEYIVEKIKL